MNIKMTYATKTGNSKKIAGHVAGKLSISADPAKDYPVYENVDLLFIVGGIYRGKSLPELVDFVRTLNPEKVKKVALITSSLSNKMFQESIREIAAEKGIKIADEFLCQGKFLFFGLGHPNLKEMDDAAAFAAGTVAKLSAHSK